MIYMRLRTLETIRMGVFGELNGPVWDFKLPVLSQLPEGSPRS